MALIAVFSIASSRHRKGPPSGPSDLPSQPPNYFVAYSLNSARAFASAGVEDAIVAMVCYGLSDFIYKQAAAAGIRADHFLMAPH